MNVVNPPCFENPQVLKILQALYFGFPVLGSYFSPAQTELCSLLVYLLLFSCLETLLFFFSETSKFDSNFVKFRMVFFANETYYVKNLLSTLFSCPLSILNGCSDVFVNYAIAFENSVTFKLFGFVVHLPFGLERDLNLVRIEVYRRLLHQWVSN